MQILSKPGSLPSPPLPLPHSNEGKKSDLEASSTGYNKRHSFPFISRCQGKQETICTTLHAHFNFYGAFVLVHVDWKITLALTPSPPHTHTQTVTALPPHTVTALSPLDRLSSSLLPLPQPHRPSVSPTQSLIEITRLVFFQSCVAFHTAGRRPPAFLSCLPFAWFFGR